MEVGLINGPGYECQGYPPDQEDWNKHPAPAVLCLVYMEESFAQAVLSCSDEEQQKQVHERISAGGCKGTLTREALFAGNRMSSVLYKSPPGPSADCMSSRFAEASDPEFDFCKSSTVPPS